MNKDFVNEGKSEEIMTLIWSNENITYQINSSKASSFIIPTINDKNINGIEVYGDIFFQLKNKKNGKLICRFALNTSFLIENGKNKKLDNNVLIYELSKNNVDPDSIAKSNDFD